MKLLTLGVMLTIAVMADAGVHRESPAPEYVIARDGRARAPICISSQASELVRRSAADLASKLGAMSGAHFEVVEVKELPDHGIVMAKGVDFNLKTDLDPAAAATVQGYRIMSSPERLLMIGESDKGVDYAMADLLYRLGYRQFSTHKNWEIIPARPELSWAGDVAESPDYLYREIWPAYGIWDWEKDSDEWFRRANREIGVVLNTGHMYEDVIRSYPEEFAKHPEYYASVDGKRSPQVDSTKFCIANPGMRKLMLQYIRRWLLEHPEESTVSMEPSDGGFWCECEGCRAIGSPSTRVILLANEAAEMMRREFPGKCIGVYAYNMHSSPPEINVAPEVVVSIANGFITGNYTFKQLCNLWHAQGATLGTRDYHDVLPWSQWAPGVSLGSDTEYCTRKIAEYYQDGSRYYSSEGGRVFGPCGLGYYLSDRVLWNVGEAERSEALKEDFYTAGFGPAAPAIKEFYEWIDGKNKPLLSRDLIGRMYRSLAAAKKAAMAEPAVLARIADLAAYTRYCELLLKRLGSKSPDDMAAQIRFVAQIADRRILNSFGAFRDYQYRNPSEFQQAGWDNAKPLTTEELLAFIEPGISANPLLTFEAINFSKKLIPAKIPGDVPAGSFNGQREFRVFYTYIEDPAKEIELYITGGMIAHYRDRGNVQIKLYQLGGASAAGTYETLIAEDAGVQPDGERHTVRLKAKYAGLHKITVNDNADMTMVEWPRGFRMMASADTENPLNLYSRATFYVYVPKNAGIFGFFMDGDAGKIIAGNGQEVLNFESGGPRNGFFALPVTGGSDGKLWKFQDVRGKIIMMTIPGLAGLSPDEFILPEEVVNKDELK